MQPSQPKFPVTYCAAIRREISREVYEDIEGLANDLEWIDTRGYPNLWLEDAEGENWDVKLDILNGDIGDTQFFHRSAPKRL